MSVRLCVTLAAACVATSVAACSSMRVHGSDPPSTNPTRGRSGGFDIPVRTAADPARAPTDPTRGDLPSSAEHPTASESRRVCRSGSRPAGWIAVAYEAGSGDECPKGRGAYPVAVLVRYASQPVDATLDVCADQHVPQHWTAEMDSPDVGQCPGAEHDGRSATKRIRRRW